MTNPKTSETRAVARTKPAATPEIPAAKDPAPDNQSVVLEQLVALTQSIKELVARSTEPTPPPPSDTTDPVVRNRVVFAYDFLGKVLGRRAPRVFEPRAVVVQRDGDFVTFTGLKVDGLPTGTFARIRSNRNVVVLLEDLRDGEPRSVATDPNENKQITFDQRIDSIVVFDKVGGTPVAIGNCLPPSNGD